MLADQDGTQLTIDPPFTVANDGKNQSIPLITLDNSCPDRVWVAWGLWLLFLALSQPLF
jgi:hypothetical protein